mmetsp:Transcript_100148/g.214534  ORF Transcript_100148/g.214534 Transcript_100148/m.214534 type:complete len:705 (+) Transcript_100148:1-2115(+)
MDQPPWAVLSVPGLPPPPPPPRSVPPPPLGTAPPLPGSSGLPTPSPSNRSGAGAGSAPLPGTPVSPTSPTASRPIASAVYAPPGASHKSGPRSAISKQTSPIVAASASAGEATPSVAKAAVPAQALASSGSATTAPEPIPPAPQDAGTADVGQVLQFAREVAAGITDAAASPASSATPSMAAPVLGSKNTSTGGDGDAGPGLEGIFFHRRATVMEAASAAEPATDADAAGSGSPAPACSPPPTPRSLRRLADKQRRTTRPSPLSFGSGGGGSTQASSPVAALPQQVQAVREALQQGTRVRHHTDGRVGTIVDSHGVAHANFTGTPTPEVLSSTRTAHEADRREADHSGNGNEAAAEMERSPTFGGSSTPASIASASAPEQFFLTQEMGSVNLLDLQDVPKFTAPAVVAATRATAVAVAPQEFLLTQEVALADQDLPAASAAAAPSDTSDTIVVQGDSIAEGGDVVPSQLIATTASGDNRRGDFAAGSGPSARLAERVAPLAMISPASSPSASPCASPDKALMPSAQQQRQEIRRRQLKEGRDYKRKHSRNLPEQESSGGQDDESQDRKAAATGGAISGASAGQAAGPRPDISSIGSRISPSGLASSSSSVVASASASSGTGDRPFTPPRRPPVHDGDGNDDRSPVSESVASSPLLSDRSGLSQEDRQRLDTEKLRGKMRERRLRTEGHDGHGPKLPSQPPPSSS